MLWHIVYKPNSVYKDIKNKSFRKLCKAHGQSKLNKLEKSIIWNTNSILGGYWIVNNKRCANIYLYKSLFLKKKSTLKYRIKLKYS